MYEYKAKIERVVDGDTVCAMVDLGFNVFGRVDFRLFGIDAPDANSTNPEERLLAKTAKDRLIGLVEGKDVIIRTHETDEYGRWLAEIKPVGYIGIGTVNSQLISDGLAKQYFGIGPKPTWS